MTTRKIYGCLVLILLLLGCSSVSRAEVGYVNILNGVKPSAAFVVERQGKVIIPDGVYTNLEEGDVVKPSTGAMLLFTPLDSACEVVEIKGEFTATSCPPADGSLKDAAYDFVSNEFMAAPQERVGVYATRGANDKRVHSLPLMALRLFVESDELAGTLKNTPFVALTSNKTEADALIMGQGVVQLLSPGETTGQKFTLPAEAAALRQGLLRRINYKTIAELANTGSWPKVEWSINIHTQAENGSVDYDGRKWALVKSIKMTGSEAQPIAVKEPCLLTFNLVNRSAKSYYAYLFNYTGSGQILPLLPPEEAPLMPNTVAASAELPLGQIFLELGESQENVRLIISENPLDLGQFKQESLTESAKATAAPTRLRPAPANSWFTAAQTFELK